jgi:high-affinity Fe2+/Pb2+ permease
MEERQKKIYFLLGAAVVLILIIVVLWIVLRKPAALPLQEAAQETEGESTYGTLPEIKSPELNPVEKTNPFKDAYKNPFE